MARMHTRRRGQSQSTRPPSKKRPKWLDLTEETVEQLALKLAEEGKTPSEIGMILRDEHGVPTFKQVTGEKLTKFLEEEGAIPDLPEDIANLVEKANNLVRHLQQNKADGKNTHSLENVEAKIHRLAKYYKSKGELPKDWKYKSVIAQVE